MYVVLHKFTMINSMCHQAELNSARANNWWRRQPTTTIRNVQSPNCHATYRALLLHPFRHATWNPIRQRAGHLGGLPPRREPPCQSTLQKSRNCSNAAVTPIVLNCKRKPWNIISDNLRAPDLTHTMPVQLMTNSLCLRIMCQTTNYYATEKQSNSNRNSREGKTDDDKTS